MIHASSLLIPLLVLLPNIAFFVTKPKDPSPGVKANGVFTLLETFENIGRVGVFTVPVFSAATFSRPEDVFALISMGFTLAIYYAGWLRYFRNNREYKLLFSPFMGIPIPMAVAPIAYFLCAAVILRSPYLFIAGTILAVGHIPISIREYHLVEGER